MSVKAWIEKPVEHIPTRNWGVNLVRGAVARLSHPLLPDDYARLFHPLWSARELRGQIIGVRPETADSTTLVIRPGWGFDPGFTPGQFVGIGVQMRGRWVWRSYSLTNIPTVSLRQRALHTPITVTVRAVPEGKLSSHLTTSILPGTVVRLQAPSGNFYLPDPLPPKLLFLTAGSGITPIMSMVRSLIKQGLPSNVVHVHSEKKADSIIFYRELCDLDKSYPDFSFHPQLTTQHGRLDQETLEKVVPDWSDRDTWGCGPSEFVESLTLWWKNSGIEDRLTTEQFDLRLKGTAEIHDDEKLGGVIRFARGQREVSVDPATTILEAGESIGIRLPYGCRMGICHTCTALLTKGKVCDLRSGYVHEEGERIQTCCTTPVGECMIDA